MTKENNTNVEMIMSCWLYFYRTQICKVGNLEEKLHFANVKYNNAIEESNEKEQKKYEKLINTTRKKYDSARCMLEVVERLDKMRITDNYKLTMYKVFNVKKEEYEDKNAIEFTGTGYTFKQSETSTFDLAADLFKDGKKVVNNA
jgi:hypothetical protein